MPRYSRSRRRRRMPYRRRKSKYAVRLPMKKRVQHTLDRPGVCLYRGGFELSSSRGEGQMAPLGSMFCKDAIDTNDFVDYDAYDLLTKVNAGTQPTSAIYVGDVRRVWMITNSSVSNVKYTIYKCSARKDVPTIVSMTACLAGAAFDYAEELTGEVNIQPTTIGATPYDCPILTNIYKVKPVARGVVGPGGTFEFKAKKNIRRLYKRLENVTYDGLTSMHDNKKYSDTYIIQWHGQPCAGMNGVNDVVTIAATVLEVATYARVTYAAVISSGVMTQSRMDGVNPFAAPTSATLYAPGNIAANAAPGVPDTVLP